MKTIQCIAMAVFLLFNASHLQADTVIFQHLGDTDPVSEGWNLNINSGGNISVGPITESGSGIDAWHVYDTSTDLNTTGGYWQTPSQEQLNQAALGWEYTVTVRTFDYSTGFYPYTIFAGFYDKTKDWLMYFYQDSNGNQFVRLAGDSEDSSRTFEVTNNPSAYHTYSLRFNPIENNADLYVDGALAISDFAGRNTSGAAIIQWGAGASNATGKGHFSLVQLQVVRGPFVVWLPLVVR
jgi:hypothetical protein